MCVQFKDSVMRAFLVRASPLFTRLPVASGLTMVTMQALSSSCLPPQIVHLCIIQFIPDTARAFVHQRLLFSAILPNAPQLCRFLLSGLPVEAADDSHVIRG
ncbi:hypothetical protein PoB_000682500 [Plakobranchus ocellatus]|uniref:Secreted protein n=1 Tax=Plakobranchus ocellatus TaxID=259542 RepID=A0AAV3YCQ7_9GAST|nr:hypothetical protein PoB_000682500 [Plakobranchus ocellatus]